LLKRTRFWRRFWIITTAAAAVTLVSLFATPSAPIYFGILHCIAAASLLALALRPLPPLVPALIGGLMLGFPPLGIGIENLPPVLLWTGLSRTTPPMSDFVPMLPFAGVVLLGAAAGRWLGRSPEGKPSETGVRRAAPLAYLGRKSLIIYLVHQPILFGLTAGAAALLPQQPRTDQQDFTAACVSECSAAGAALSRCERVCGCTAERLAGEGLFSHSPINENDPAVSEKVAAASRLCLQLNR
jgi:uncharacterized membrane protein